MENITINGYHLPTLAKLVKELGSPSTGKLASIVWDISTRASLPYAYGESFMIACGYKPYRGYPLTKEGK